MSEETCRFCRQFGIGEEGFICQKTGRTVDGEDSCSDYEGL